MKNDGSVIKKAKSIKGGWVIQSIFDVFRHRSEIAIASKFTKLKRNKIYISFCEHFNDCGYVWPDKATKEELDKNGTTDFYEVIVTKKITNKVLQGLEPYNEAYLKTSDFQKANEFFIEWVNKMKLNNDVYLSQRYNDKVNGEFNKFDYLTFLRKESNAL